MKALITAAGGGIMKILSSSLTLGGNSALAALFQLGMPTGLENNSEWAQAIDSL